jgi:hypothetical protein
VQPIAQLPPLTALLLCVPDVAAFVVSIDHHVQVEPIVDERKKLNVQIQAHLPQVRQGREAVGGL